MRNSACKSAHCLHLLRLKEFPFQHAPLGHITADSLDSTHDAVFPDRPKTKFQGCGPPRFPPQRHLASCRLQRAQELSSALFIYRCALRVEHVCHPRAQGYRGRESTEHLAGLVECKKSALGSSREDKVIRVFE